jgi:hypothetical protein
MCSKLEFSVPSVLSVVKVFGVKRKRLGARAEAIVFSIPRQGTLTPALSRWERESEMFC